jgi:hypothetical protein
MAFEWTPALEDQLFNQWWRSSQLTHLLKE